MSSPPQAPPEVAHSTKEPASQRVFSNSLVMSEIFSWLPHKALVKCLVTSKAGFKMALEGVHLDAPSDLGVLLSEAMCNLVSLPR